MRTRAKGHSCHKPAISGLGALLLRFCPVFSHGSWPNIWFGWIQCNSNCAPAFNGTECLDKEVPLDVGACSRALQERVSELQLFLLQSHWPQSWPLTYQGSWDRWRKSNYRCSPSAILWSTIPPMFQAPTEEHWASPSSPRFPVFLQQFLLEIFSETDESGTHQKGLVDCKDEDSFFDALSELKGTWDNREKNSVWARSPTTVSQLVLQVQGQGFQWRYTQYHTRAGWPWMSTTAILHES